MDKELDSEESASGESPRINMDSYQPINNQSAGKKKFLITVGLIIVLLLLGYFTFTLLSGSSNKSENSKTETVIEQTPTPEPTPEITLDRAEWILEVANGSGTSGLAKKIADQLKELGYQVIKVGNADRDDYSETQIQVKEGLQDKANLVIVDVKDIIKIASVGGVLKDSTASARIIIGKQ